MINKTRIMLYVEDVKIISRFWQDNVDAEITEDNRLDKGYQNLVLEISPEVELSLFPKEFIKEFSPEVLGSTPSIMFFSNKFEELHARLNPTANVRTVNGTKTFNFPDPEGNYFVVAKSED